MCRFLVYIIVFITVFILSIGNLPAAEELKLDEEPETTDIIKSALKDEDYETGLNVRGTTGLILTARPECLFEKGQFVGFSLFSSTLEYQNDTTTDLGISASYAYGFYKDLPLTLFDHIEFSASLPLIMRDSPDGTTTGFGEALCSAKVQILEEDPLRPVIPAVGLLVGLTLPIGNEEFEHTDSLGLEAGIIAGKTLMDSAGLATFKVYVEFRGSVIEKDGETDFLFKANAGMAFPVGMYDDWFILFEYENISRSDINGEDGHIYLLGMQYMEETFNITLGFITQYIDVIDTYQRKIVIMGDIKF